MTATTRVTGDILVDARERGDVWITIDRARKHNALARKVLAALADAVREHASRETTRCIVVRGAGERYFAAGGDLLDLADVRSEADTDAMTREATAALDAIRDCDVPVIAYVNGDALGGGAELAVACDMRVVVPHANIGFVHGRLAITPAWGGGTDLCRLLGAARALRMMARCEMVGAEAALAWGLVDAVATGGPEGTGVIAFLKPLLDLPPHVLRAMKAQATAARHGLPREGQRDLERRNLVATWRHADHWAAVDRFLVRDRYPN